MITVTVYKESGEYKGFSCTGHSGYAEEGNDIVCAAVSALTINTANSIDRYTDDTISVNVKDGLLELHFEDTVSEKSRLLMDSMISGLQDVKDNYGGEFIAFIFREV